ncbi:YbjN domain-containing protein [Mycobacterium basiliense]|nr:YbjN domain-containing protein [Mycobacterium basiliense]
MTESLDTKLIERYLRARGRRYFRGQHDGEFFFVMNVVRLHVHLEIPVTDREIFTIRVTPACFFPAADAPTLRQVVDTWNDQCREVTATLHGSSDPHRIGVAAIVSQPVENGVAFEDFAMFVDHAIAAAIEFFDGLTPIAELSSTPLLRDAG